MERPISLRNDVDVVDDVVLEPSFEESVKDELVLKNIGARDLFSGSGDGDKKKTADPHPNLNPFF